MSEGPFFFVLGGCCVCHQPFTFNPELVPSIPVLIDGTVGPGGVRQPVCRNCITRMNLLREQHGWPPLEVLDGAYEPAEGFPAD